MDRNTIIGITIMFALGFIFLFYKVLKNTRRNFWFDPHIAYDGKYYKANVIAQLKFDAQNTMTIADLSQYDEKGIAMFTLYLPESAEEYCRCIYGECTKANLKEVQTPRLIKNAIVYAPEEGVWTWKLPQ